jgi:hypothetical protein
MIGGLENEIVTFVFGNLAFEIAVIGALLGLPLVGGLQRENHCSIKDANPARQRWVLTVL